MKRVTLVVAAPPLWCRRTPFATLCAATMFSGVQWTRWGEVFSIRIAVRLGPYGLIVASC